MAATFLDELAVLGPSAPQAAVSAADADAYCRRLAKTHYENFSVASWLLPKHLRQPFYNVYAYCRWADDLADETGDAEQSLDLLAWWEHELDRCYAGEATHPVFVALRKTIDAYAIPATPFRELLIAFRRDQLQTRYATYEELLAYCRYSANPVGHLVLHLGRCANEVNLQLSDCVCTGLQLANHWQDVARDYHIGRVYLPQDDLLRFDVTEPMLAASTASDQVRALLKLEVDRAEALLREGEPLANRVSDDLRMQVRLFVQGGLAILDQIRRQNYDVLASRPKVSKWQQLRLLLCAWWRKGAQ